MTKPTAYSQVVEVNGPHRIIFIAGQTGVDSSGKAAQGFRALANPSYLIEVEAMAVLPPKA